MSKRSSLSASSRLRSKKESSVAPMRPTKKKSLSLHRSTQVSQNRKGTGTLQAAMENMTKGKKLNASTLKLMVSEVKQLMLATGNPRKLALLLQVAGHLMEEAGRSQQTAMSVEELLQREG